MFANSQVLYITAAVIGLIGIIPNMPHVAFFADCFFAGWSGLGAGAQQTRDAAEAEFNEPDLADAQQLTETPWPKSAGVMCRRWIQSVWRSATG